MYIYMYLHGSLYKGYGILKPFLSCVQQSTQWNLIPVHNHGAMELFLHVSSQFAPVGFLSLNLFARCQASGHSPHPYLQFIYFVVRISEVVEIARFKKSPVVFKEDTGRCIVWVNWAPPLYLASNWPNKAVHPCSHVTDDITLCKIHLLLQTISPLIFSPLTGCFV